MDVTFYDRRGVQVTPPAGAIVKPRRGAFVLARSQDSFLLVWPKIANGAPDLPGGGVDEGETLEQAAGREWTEETGLAFAPSTGILRTYHHVYGFHADGVGEYWIYDQTFFLYGYERQTTVSQRWPNPEGNEASWEKTEDLKNIPINRAHWLAFEALVPEVDQP